MSALKRTFLFISLVAGTPAFRRNLDLRPRDNVACPVATVIVTATPASGPVAAIVSMTQTVATVTTVVPGTGGNLVSCFNGPTIIPAAGPPPGPPPPEPVKPEEPAPSADADPPADPVVAGGARLVKRNGQSFAVYEYIQQVECECEHSTTTTTSYSYSLLGCTTTQTTTLTTTLPVGNVAQTVVVPATVTVTAAAAAGQSLAPQPQGLNYYYYNDQPFTPAGFGPFKDYKGTGFKVAPGRARALSNHANFAHSGTVANVNALKLGPQPGVNDPANWRLEMPDGYVSGYELQTNVIFQGYLYAAKGAGSYSITTPADIIDDFAYVWTGDKALGNNWSPDNADYKAQYGDPTTGTITLQLQAGQAIPVTLLFVDLFGVGTSAFYVTTPDGSVYKDTTGFFVGGCNNAGFIP